MAKRVIVESDLSGEPDASTVSFAFDGNSYTIDLTEGEKEEFAKLLSSYLDVAEEATPSGQGSVSTQTQSAGPDPAKVRAWAQDSGIEVNAKGRVPHSVVAQYLRAQEDTADA
ncbi:histone-like nucleoid-structuring protein Lsr2 [Streptomyces chartreusis]|uniref:histone-like nucleoid-structuring protein Lsr2 n=1 Tax=Streptomyces chartreusis TaxID=1969 RepID=UPI00380E2276